MSGEPSDPRRLPRTEGIVGPGGPHDRAGVVIAAAGALLPEGLSVAVTSVGASGEEVPALAVQVDARVSGTGERVRVLLLLSVDAAAALVTEVVDFGVGLPRAIAARAGAMP